MHIHGKHAFVTGAAKRLGRSMAERLLSEGARITAHYRQSRAEAQALQQLAPERIRLVTGDLSSVESVQKAAAPNDFGAIDILVNSASDFYPTPLDQITEEVWDHFQDVNVKGHFFLTQALLPRLSSGSVIINLVDVNAERPMKNYTPYVISKAGLLMLTRNLAKELAPKTRVNSISPGAVLLPTHYTPEQVQRSIDKTLLKRLGSAEDIVEAMLFLVKNDYITGFDLKIDGGRSLV